MAKKININSALTTKKQELDTQAEAAKQHVAYLKSQIGASEADAALYSKQALAAETALGILNDAGVTVL